MKNLKYFGIALFNFALYLLLPLVAWGLDDLSGYFANPLRLIFALYLTLIQFPLTVYQVVSQQGIGFKSGKAENFVARQHLALSLARLLLLGALLFIPFADRRELGTLADLNVVRGLGLALYALGGLWAFWSAFALGKQYSVEVTLQTDHHLITSGPYHYIRHPRYLGVFLAGVGYVLLFRSWLGIVGTLFLLAIFLARIADEEILLSHEFGTEWEDYRKHSWRLLPFIY